MPSDEHDPAPREAITTAPRSETPTVSVQGQAAIRTEPDEAFVWITLTALDSSAATALTDVARRSQALAELLTELGIDRRDRSTTGITVHEEFDHTREGRRSLGHRSEETLSVRLGDRELIGRVIIRATDEVDARIDGPSWHVSADNPVWLQAARLAAANARQKAEAYAAGVDARLGSVIALSEFERVGGTGRFPMAAALSTSAPPELDVEAGEQEVAAAIRGTFALEIDPEVDQRSTG